MTDGGNRAILVTGCSSGIGRCVADGLRGRGYRVFATARDPADVAALSDAEIATILTQMEQDNAGADIIGTLFTVFIILLVTDLLCFTNLFSFTRCIR